MEYKVKIDKILFLVEQEMQAEMDYILTSKAARRTSCLDTEKWKKAKEQQRYAYECSQKAKDAVSAIAAVLDISGSQYNRMYSATRAYLRFCNRNGWERFPSEETYESLGRYIFAKPKELSYDWVPGYLKRRKEMMANAKA